MFLGAGTHVLSVTFTFRPMPPTADTRGSSATTPLTVVKAPLTIAASSLAADGAPLPPLGERIRFRQRGRARLVDGRAELQMPATAASAVGTIR